MKRKWIPLLNEPHGTEGAFLWLAATGFGMVFTFGMVYYAVIGHVLASVLSAPAALLCFALAVVASDE